MEAKDISPPGRIDVCSSFTGSSSRSISDFGFRCCPERIYFVRNDSLQSDLFDLRKVARNRQSIFLRFVSIFLVFEPFSALNIVLSLYSESDGVYNCSAPPSFIKSHINLLLACAIPVWVWGVFVASILTYSAHFPVLSSLPRIFSLLPNVGYVTVGIGDTMVSYEIHSIVRLSKYSFL